MTPPRYQDLRAADIPTVERDGVTAKVIAGEALGVVGPANTHVPILYVHARRRGSDARLDVPRGHQRLRVRAVGLGEFGPDAPGAVRAARGVRAFGRHGEDSRWCRKRSR